MKLNGRVITILVLTRTENMAIVKHLTQADSIYLKRYYIILSSLLFSYTRPLNCSDKIDPIINQRLNQRTSDLRYDDRIYTYRNDIT